MNIGMLITEKGTSLLEVLIAVAITGIVITSIFKLYIVQHENYTIQNDITDIQQNARATIDELSRNIRMAGYNLPYGIPGIEASNQFSDTISITYLNSDCKSYLATSMTSLSDNIQCASDVSCFEPGQWVYIFDSDSAYGEWIEIAQVSTSTKTIDYTQSSLSQKYNTNALVMSLTQIKFYVDYVTDPYNPKLMMQLHGMDPVVYAENISDMQLKYTMKNGIEVDEPPIIENTRQVQISVTGRSANPSLDENGSQIYRYKNYSTSVFLRNFGI